MKRIASIMAMGTGSVGSASSLLTGLAVYYKLSDTSDSSGNGLTLTNNNTVTFSTGKVGNAADFVAASTHYLSRADNAAFQMGTGSVSMCAWVKSSGGAFPNNSYVAAYGTSGGTGYGIRTSTVAVQAWINGTGGSAAVFTTAVTNIANNAWRLIIFTADRAGSISCYIDNSLENAQSITGDTGSVNSTGGFSIGAANTAAAYYTGSIDEVGIWNRVLDSTERSALWNGGTGVTYPF